MSKKSLENLKKEVSSIHNGLSFAFKKVGSELSEHLDTINANTSEIDSLTQMFYHLEQKIDKLNERIDELSVTSSMSNYSDSEYALSIKEQEVFVTLYTSNDFLSIREIARSIGRTSETVNFIISKLISKNIPVIKDGPSSKLVYALDKEFKQLQAKNNIVRLHETVLRELSC